jgi:NADH-quinone oxidoreductase E subunit
MIQTTYAFTPDELAEVERIKAKYPHHQSAVMPVLWMAQDKFGHVDADVQRLVAATLALPESHVHGVATFYTQYFKEKQGKYVLDVCTCLSCHIGGGYEMLHYLEEKLGIKEGETTADGKFTVKGVECLGACGYAPMMQITNDVFVNHLTTDKLDQVIESLKKDELPAFEPIPLVQNRA